MRAMTGRLCAAIVLLVMAVAVLAPPGAAQAEASRAECGESCADVVAEDAGRVAHPDCLWSVACLGGAAMTLGSAAAATADAVTAVGAGRPAAWSAVVPPSAAALPLLLIDDGPDEPPRLA